MTYIVINCVNVVSKYLILYFLWNDKMSVLKRDKLRRHCDIPLGYCWPSDDDRSEGRPSPSMGLCHLYIVCFLVYCTVFPLGWILKFGEQGSVRFLFPWEKPFKFHMTPNSQNNVIHKTPGRIKNLFVISFRSDS